MFGGFGGRWMPETLMPALQELEKQWNAAREDPIFLGERESLHRTFVGGPSPLHRVARCSDELGIELYLKREDLNHTGSHKINNCLGQVLLARRMGKTRVIAETGAGQHGVAAATVCALFGLECVVYMGSLDMSRQLPNVERMRLLGAEVRPVDSGSATLKDAMNEALRDWIAHVENTYYMLGTGAGPHPYPSMVRDLQSVIGIEARRQILKSTGRLPDCLVACVGGGSNAIGLFHPFLEDSSVRMFGVEAAGDGLETGRHAACLQRGRPGVLHGSRTMLLQNHEGQIMEAHSISAGLDYPGVGPEHSHLQEVGRVRYVSATDHQALSAFHWLARREGILPALESAHALAFVRELAPDLNPGSIVVACLSGRGDKDLNTVLSHPEMQP
ncbi:MAG: tryptophan synthase subunit beta [Fibrobacterota bacterium]|nr:MAG: tryptophan synthase subunit beta [Fibrobacterota bacterium]